MMCYLSDGDRVPSVVVGMGVVWGVFGFESKNLNECSH